jgi:hypothetical protein
LRRRNTLSLIAYCAWQATSTDEWIKVQTGSGNAGPHKLRFVVEKNETSAVRNGKIVISNSKYNVSSELKVIQKEYSPKLNVEISSLEFDYRGGDKTVAVISNLADYDVAAPDWISYTKRNGVTNSDRVRAVAVVY